MKKSTIIVKRLLALFLVVLMSIESLGAVVGDNDGSAFITKAEFDSLKNNFQSQIDNYNTSIDSKIDGAIASYLSGIKMTRKEELKNLYDELGGDNIRFGNPNIVPTIKPKTGWALTYFNCDKWGYSFSNLGAGKDSIMNSASSRWVTDGGMTLGQFVEYKKSNERIFLSKYRNAALQACFVGGWYTARATVVRSSINAPWNHNEVELGAPLSPASRLNVDSFSSLYRAYDKVEPLDLQNWTFAYAVDTTNDKIFLADEKKTTIYPDKYAVGTFQGGQTYGNNTNTPTDGAQHDTSDLTVTNIWFGDWDIESDKTLTVLEPGFYYNRALSNKLYGGVHFFESSGSGDVEITDMKFLRSTPGDVYFAISDEPFANVDELSGNIKLTSVTGASLDSEPHNRYKVVSGTKVALEFPIGKKTYYIKCQPSITKTANNDLYCGIEEGAKITATYE